MKQKHWIAGKFESLFDDWPGGSDRLKALIKKDIISKAIFFDNKALKFQKQTKIVDWLTLVTAIIGTTTGTALVGEAPKVVAYIAAGSGVVATATTAFKGKFSPEMNYERSRRSAELIQSEMLKMLYNTEEYHGLSPEDAVSLCGSRAIEIDVGNMSEQFTPVSPSKKESRPDDYQNDHQNDFAMFSPQAEDPRLTANDFRLHGMRDH